MINLDIVGKPLDAIEFEYTWKDVVLYNLGIGAKATDLEFVYENATEGLKPFPTFAVVPTLTNVGVVMGELNVNMMMLLHGEQHIVIHNPIPSDGVLSTVAEVTNIYDKGKGALAVIKTTSADGNGTPIFDNIVSLFCRGEGGFDGDSGPKVETYDPPEGKAPDFDVTLETNEDQAALYRLSGDINPLHIDPNFASMGGFDRPILHGLCTYGIAGRAVLEGACGGDVSKFKEYKARFVKPVFPGQSINTKGWNMGGGVYHVISTAEGDVVLNQAFAKVAE